MSNDLATIFSEDLEIIKSIATGGQKKVSLCRWKSKNIEVVQCVLLDNEDEEIYAKLKSEFQSEIEVLKELAEYKNIVKIYGVISKKIAFVTEYCSKGNLHRALRSNVIPLNTRAMICKSIARTMMFLHSLPMPLLHGDLSTSNVLLTTDLTPKLCDFGLSRIQNKTVGLTKNEERGTINFMAPEQISNESKYVTFKADIWSFAMICIELFHPKHCMPYESFHSHARPFQIANFKLPSELSDVTPSSLVPFLSTLLVPADSRPNFKEVLDGLRKIFPPNDFPEDKSEEDNVTLEQIRKRKEKLPSKSIANISTATTSVQTVIPIDPVSQIALASKKKEEDKRNVKKPIAVPIVKKPVVIIPVKPIASEKPVKKKHAGFWRYPPVGHIKGEWSCCGSSSYHDEYCH